MGTNPERELLALKKAQEIKKALTGMIIHDLNNPLTAVSGGLQLALLEGEDRLTENQKKNLEIAFLAAKELKRMIGSLRDIENIEDGTLEPKRDCFRVDAVLKEIVQEMNKIAAYDEKRVLLQAEEGMPVMSADKELVRRAVATLINNALRAAPMKSAVEVAVSYGKDDKTFRVRVDDSGETIPEEYLEKVFNKDIQVETEKKVKVNQALGLTFCRMIADLHGGKIWAENRPKGGNRFTFALPHAEP